LAIVVLVTAVAAGPRLLRLIGLGAIGLAGIFLLATRSKTSIGVAGLMVLAGPCLYVTLGRQAPFRLGATGALLGVGTLVAVAFSAAGYDDADLRMLLFGDLTFTGRTDIWTHLVQEIARRPWLGRGFGSFWDTGQLYNPIESAAQSDWFMNAQLINSAHDGYLDVLLQTGLVGFAIAVTAILRCLALLAAGAAAGDRAERVALTGALCVAVCLVLNNFLESYLFRTGDTLGYLFIFLMLHGEAVRLHRRGRPGTTAATAAP
jgi:exopolysaccharide production protein ExoQ